MIMPLVDPTETDHPYALSTWEGRFPCVIPGDGVNDLLRVKAPKSYWLALESQYPDYFNQYGFSPIEVLRRQLYGSNGCPPLGESFTTRVRRTISALRKTFYDTDWHEKSDFKNDLMWISIKRHDFLYPAQVDFPNYVTPPPRFGPKPHPSAMKEHIPNYDPGKDPEPADEFEWEAMLGIPQIGCESVVADEHCQVSNEGVGQIVHYYDSDITEGINFVDSA